MEQYLIDDVSKVYSTIHTMTNKQIVSLAILHNNTSVVFHSPGESRINTELCELMDIPLMPISSTKGPVISQSGDIAAMIWLPKLSLENWGQYVFNHLNKYLTNYQLKIRLIGNDILLHNRKIGGYSNEITPTGSIGVLFIAMNDAQNVVNQICLKHTDKKTAGLYNYGITAKEIKDQIIIASEAYVKLLNLEGGK